MEVRQMNIIELCLVIIVLSMITIALVSIFIVLEIKKIKGSIETLIRQIEREIVPLTAEIRQIAEDVKSVTKITRCQLERIDSSINYASSNLISVIDTVVKTVNTVRQGILSPFNNLIAILKGVSRGVEYFFRNK
jgi:predicted PurR-regulated permease PerM